MHSHEERHPNSRSPTNSAAMVSVVALSTALLASVCCIGPLLLVTLGIGVGATGALAGTTEFLKRLLPYRPLFVGLTLLLFGASFYMAYRNSSSAFGTEGVCTARSAKGANRKWLWVMAALAFVLILAPYWLAL
jgi:mercuric ion transport protein